MIGRRCSRLDDQTDLAVVIRQHVGEDAADVLEHAADVDRLHLLARKFGIEARGARNIVDQTVEPLQLGLDLLHELGAVGVGFRIGERFGGRARRRKRIFQLMRDIGRKLLARFDAPVECVRHCDEGAARLADLVASRR